MLCLLCQHRLRGRCCGRHGSSSETETQPGDLGPSGSRGRSPRAPRSPGGAVTSDTAACRSRPSPGPATRASSSAGLWQQQQHKPNGVEQLVLNRNHPNNLISTQRGEGLHLPRQALRLLRAAGKGGHSHAGQSRPRLRGRGWAWPALGGAPERTGRGRGAFGLNWAEPAPSLLPDPPRAKSVWV